MVKKNNTTAIVIGLLIAVAIFYYGGTKGWFKSDLTINLPDTINFNDFETLFPDPSCTFTFDKSTALIGEDVTATLRDGALKRCVVAYNYEGSGWKIYNVENLDVNGVVTETQSAEIPGTYVWTALCGYFEGENFIVECRTNNAFIEILPVASPPPSDTPEVGDNVGEGTIGSGSGSFGDDLTTEITMDWTTGGPYVLGAKITRSWDYKDPECMYPPQQYPMEWTLYDSNGMAWQKYDYVPVSNVVDTVCPVTYHEDSPWSFVVSIGIQDCDVSYSWKVQPYICGEI